MDIKAKQEYAKAFSAAFVADIERSPSIKSAIVGRKLDAHGLANMAYRSLSNKDHNLFPNLRRIVKEAAKLEIAPSFGMGQWAELAGALISTAANVATKTYTAKLEAQTATSIAKIQTQTQQAAAAAAELQAKAAQLQYSNAEAAVRRAEEAAGPTPSVLGVPWWGIALGVVGIGGIGYLLLKRRSRR